MLAEELRSGLASILGYSRTLELRAPRLTDEERAEFAGRISVQADRLARLADYLQTIAQMETAPTQEPADASAVVRAVATELAEVVSGHGITTELNLATSLPARAGSAALHQIVASLVLAALQVTTDGSRLHISTRPSRKNAVVEIVATAARPEASARLEGLATTTADATGPAAETTSWSTGTTAWTPLGPGTELGLSLVRHLVEAHGGTLDIDLAGEAMTVCVEVPQSQQGAPGAGGTPAGGRTAGSGATGEGPGTTSALAP